MGTSKIVMFSIIYYVKKLTCKQLQHWLMACDVHQLCRHEVLSYTLEPLNLNLILL